MKQFDIRRGSQLGHEICTLITLSESMTDSYIILINQILNILDQDRVNMIPHCRSFEEVNTMQGVRVANKINNIQAFSQS